MQDSKPRRSTGRLRLRPMNTIFDRRASPAFQGPMQFTQHPAAHVYHYNHYEPTALKRLAMRHGTREAALDNMLRRQRFVDLYVVVREQIRISEPRYSLKNVEKFFRDERNGEVESAGDSIVAYERYCDTGEASILSEIEAYNKVDCISTAELRDWLLGLRPADAAWFDPAVLAPDAAAEERQRLAEAERAAILSALLEGVPEVERPYRKLVAELCEFHHREQKPQWWAMFDRRGGTDLRCRLPRWPHGERSLRKGQAIPGAVLWLPAAGHQAA